MLVFSVFSGVNTMIDLREKDREHEQPEVVQVKQVSTEDQTEVLMEEIVRGIMNKVDERLKSISIHSPQVIDQTPIIEPCMSSNQDNLIANSQDSSGRGGTQLAHHTPRISFF